MQLIAGSFLSKIVKSEPIQEEVTFQDSGLAECLFYAREPCLQIQGV